MTDDSAQMAKVLGSVLILTESLLNGVKYTGEELERARSLVTRANNCLDRSNQRRKQ